MFISGVPEIYSQFIAALSSVKSPKVISANKNIREFSAIEFIKWAESEDPIESSHNDLLGCGHRVDRLLRFLAKARRNTIAIQGRYGSGKTSLTNLVAEKARSTGLKNVLFVWVSCWGFNDSAAAQQAVLAQIIEMLSDRVDCFAIKRMPSRFVEALSGTSDYLNSVFHLVAPRDPDAQLRQLSPILCALNARLVVVVGDTERSSTQFDVESIEGLLNRFRDIPEISFVITAGPDARIDFVRLCEHTEMIPDLDAEVVSTILDAVRFHCREKFQNDIDLVERKPFYASPPWMGADKYGMWEFQMATLVNTPRKLKATARRFSGAWDVLHGEVDIDELLIASCLRVCAPSAFGFLMRRYNEFGTIEKKKNGSEHPPSPVITRLKDEWSNLKDYGFDLPAAGKLLQMFLSPEAQVVFGEPQYRRTNLVQEFRSQTRYRQRIFNEVLSGDELLDQQILRELFHAARDNELHKIGRRIEESAEFRHIFDHFLRYMLGDKLKKEEFRIIIKGVFATIRDKYGSKANEGCEAYFETIHWVQLCFKELNEYYEAAFELVQDSIPGSLHLAVHIYHDLILRGAAASTLDEYGGRVMQLLKKAFSTNGSDILDRALDESLPDTLHKLIGFNLSPDKRSKPDWKEWGWFGPVLLGGLKLNHQKFTPQIALLLGATFTGDGVPVDFLVNEAVLDGIFGKDAEVVMAELTKPFAINEAGKRFQKEVHGVDFSLVNLRAQKWLEKRRSQ